MLRMLFSGDITILGLFEAATPPALPDSHIPRILFCLSILKRLASALLAHLSSHDNIE